MQIIIAMGEQKNTNFNNEEDDEEDNEEENVIKKGEH